MKNRQNDFEDESRESAEIKKRLLRNLTVDFILHVLRVILTVALFIEILLIIRRLKFGV